MNPLLINKALITPPAQKTSTRSNYELRADGTQKGSGWLGPIQRPDGRVMTEVGIGVNLGGKDMEIPSLVPTLNSDEVAYIRDTPLGSLSKSNPDMWRSIIQKAVDHARLRINQNKSPFID